MNCLPVLVWSTETKMKRRMLYKVPNMSKIPVDDTQRSPHSPTNERTTLPTLPYPLFTFKRQVSLSPKRAQVI